MGSAARTSAIVLTPHDKSLVLGLADLVNVQLVWKANILGSACFNRRGLGSAGVKHISGLINPYLSNAFHPFNDGYLP